jgi:hypothetical protein
MTRIDTRIGSQPYNHYINEESIFTQHKSQKLSKPARPADKLLKLR